MARTIRAIAAFAGALALAGFDCSELSRHDAQLRALFMRTAAHIRPAGARLSFARDERPQRRAPAAPSFELAALIRLDQELDARAARPSALTRHIAAWRPLLAARGNWRNTDWGRAITDLEAALRQAHDRTQRQAIRNDLAIAHFARGLALDQIHDFDRALGLLEALAIEPKPLRVALLNRAWILERLGLDDMAREAWNGFLQPRPTTSHAQSSPSTSAWAREARAHRKRLARPDAALRWKQDRPRIEHAWRTRDREALRTSSTHHRQRLRELAERQWLGMWAEARHARDDRLAAHLLDWLRLLGQALGEAGGDRLLHDTVATIDRAAGDRARLSDLVRGHRAYRQGVQLYQAAAYGAASKRLLEAQRRLAHAGSPFAWRATFYHATSRYQRNALAEARTLFDRCLGAIDRRYSALRAHCLWMSGLVALADGRAGAALPAYRAAVAGFLRAGEPANAAWVRSLSAEASDYLGRLKEACHLYFEALRAGPTAASGSTRYAALSMLGDATLRRDLPTLARLVHGEALAAARKLGDPKDTDEARFWYAVVLDRQGKTQAALAQLRRARHSLDQRRDEDAVLDRSRIDLAEGMIRAARAPQRAARLIDSARTAFRRSGKKTLTLIALQQRARVSRSLGDLARTQADLEAAIALRAAMLAGHGTLADRLAFLLDLRSLDTELIRLLALDRHDPAAALAHLEAARTRLSRPRRPRGEAQTQEDPPPLSADALVRQLDKGTVLIHAVLLEQRLLIWRLDPSGVRFFTPPVRRAQLVAQIATMDNMTQTPAFDQASSAVYTKLVAPWIEDLQGSHLLVFLPDPALERLPFAALRNPDTGRYLMQDHVVARAPSGTFYLRAKERSRALRRTGSPATGLLVTNPATDPLEDLPPLPSAARLGTELARRTGAKLLSGSSATAAAFRRLAPAAQWIHLGVHALIDPARPARSHLALAIDESRGATGALSVRDLERMSFAHTRFVVLAACRSADGGALGTSGASSLARALLTAGVPTVITTLRTIDDNASSALFARFYHHLLAGMGPAQALGAAQRDLWRQHQPLWAWAPFVTIGAASGPPTDR